MEKKFFHKTFLGLNDAYDWFYDTLVHEMSDTLVIHEASIKYVNGAWFAAIMLTSSQGELFLDGG